MTRPAPPAATLRRLLAAAACAALAAGCTSAPPTRFHTLLDAPAAPAAPAGAPLAWELLPVTVPAQVDQPQLVVRAGDGTLALLESERWIAPLADEYRAALAERLTRALGPPGGPGGTGGKAWRIRVDVQRFDSLPAAYVREEATWSVAAGSATLTCHGSLQERVEAGFPALAAGHRKAIERLGDAIAATLRELDAGRTPACPPAAAAG